MPTDLITRLAHADRVCSGRERFPNDGLGGVYYRGALLVSSDDALTRSGMWWAFDGRRATEYIRPPQSDEWDLDHEGID